MFSRLVALLQLVCLVATGPVFVDIHIPVGGDSYDAAIEANKFLNGKLGNSEIDFQKADTPHVTLYLTAWTCPEGDAKFACVSQIEDAVASTMYDLYIPGKFGPCNIAVSAPYATGTYAMMNVTDTSGCLQRYSDLIVNATYHLSEPNQKAPSWVNTLPEPERSEKIHDVKEYGSPNVFNQFQPHVSVAWSSDASAVKAAVAELKTKKTTFLGDIVALGSVGNHGTVLKDKDLAIFNVTVRKPCKHFTTQAPCDADNLTAGGCVWCDVVDHPPFCTTKTNARTFEPQPPFHCNF
jgi:hypothetical protein